MKHFLFLLCFSSLAFAHDVDRPCEPWEITEDGCQEITPGLGLENPLFFEAHKEYRHCRRLLVAEDTVNFAKCRGAVSELYAQLGQIEPPDLEGDGFLAYWHVIPAHPELDKPGDVARVIGQTIACEFGRKRAGELIVECQKARLILSGRVAAKVQKVCPRRRR